MAEHWPRQVAASGGKHKLKEVGIGNQAASSNRGLAMGAYTASGPPRNDHVPMFQLAASRSDDYGSLARSGKPTGQWTTHSPPAARPMPTRFAASCPAVAFLG